MGFEYRLAHLSPYPKPAYIDASPRYSKSTEGHGGLNIVRASIFSAKSSKKGRITLGQTHAHLVESLCGLLRRTARLSRPFASPGRLRRAVLHDWSQRPNGPCSQ